MKFSSFDFNLEEKIPRLSRLLWASEQLQNAKRKSSEDTSLVVLSLEQVNGFDEVFG